MTGKQRHTAPEEEEEELYTVEEILDYDLRDVLNVKEDLDYDASLGSGKRWEVRYFVSWKDYGDDANSWEPRSCFVEWTSDYDRQIKAIQKRTGRATVKALSKTAKERNEAARQRLKRTRATKSAKQTPRVKVKEERVELKPSSHALSQSLRAGSEASTSSRASPHVSQQQPKRRETRNSLLDANPEGLNDFFASNAPAHLRRQLQYTGLPKRDADGNLVSSSESGDTNPSQDGNPSEREEGGDHGFADSDSDDAVAAPAAQEVLVQPVAAAPGGGRDDDGFAESDDEMVHVAGPSHGLPVARGSDDGFAESDDDGDTPMAVPPAPAPATGAGDGFADSDSDDDNGGSMPAQSTSATPAHALGDSGGFAEDDSDEDQPMAMMIRKKDGKTFSTKEASSKSTVKGKGKERRTSEDKGTSSSKVAPSFPPPAARLKKPLPALSLATMGRIKKKSEVLPTPAKPALKKPRIVLSDSDSEDPPLVVVDPARPPAPPLPAPKPAVAHRPPPTASVVTKDISRDPRRRPSTDVDGRSASHSTSDSAVKKAQVEDIFNKGITRPESIGGFIPLNSSVLESNLRAGNTFLARLKMPSSAHDPLHLRVRREWGIGDPLLNFFDFDAVLREGPDGRPRTAFIFASRKDTNLGISKEARAVKEDYVALQLVLSTVAGVRQAASLLEPSVSAVFVHVSDIGEIGRNPTGKLANLEGLRNRPPGHTIFIVFGEREKMEGRGAFGERDDELFGTTRVGKEKVFTRFWDSTAAITFTPSSFLADSKRFSALATKWSQSLNRWPRQRDLFLWTHPSYFLPGGDFAIPDKSSSEAASLQRPEEATRRGAIYDLHAATRDGIIQLVGEVPRAGPHPTHHFPGPHDSSEYGPLAFRKLVGWFPPQCGFKTIDELQRLAAVYSSQYLHLRRWVIIATADEIDSVKTKLPGIDLLTLSQAEFELGKDRLAGPH